MAADDSAMMFPAVIQAKGVSVGRAKATKNTNNVKNKCIFGGHHVESGSMKPKCLPFPKLSARQFTYTTNAQRGVPRCELSLRRGRGGIQHLVSSPKCNPFQIPLRESVAEDIRSCDEDGCSNYGIRFIYRNACECNLEILKGFLPTYDGYENLCCKPHLRLDPNRKLNDEVDAEKLAMFHKKLQSPFSRQAKGFASSAKTCTENLSFPSAHSRRPGRRCVSPTLQPTSPYPDTRYLFRKKLLELAKRKFEENIDLETMITPSPPTVISPSVESNASYERYSTDKPDEIPSVSSKAFSLDKEGDGKPLLQMDDEDDEAEDTDSNLTDWNALLTGEFEVDEFSSQVLYEKPLRQQNEYSAELTDAGPAAEFNGENELDTDIIEELTLMTDQLIEMNKASTPEPPISPTADLTAADADGSFDKSESQTESISSTENAPGGENEEADEEEQRQEQEEQEEEREEEQEQDDEDEVKIAEFNPSGGDSKNSATGINEAISGDVEESQGELSDGE